MSPSKGQAPEKGAAVSHHSQEDRGEVGGGMSAALTAALLPGLG